MCHVRRVDHPCKHFKCSLWTLCDDFHKLPYPEREKMDRTGLYRCPKEEGATEEIVTVSGAKAFIVTTLDRATKSVNRSLPFGIQLPSAGCAECHKANVLSKMALDVKWSKFEKLKAMMKELKENTSEAATEHHGSGDKSEDQSAKHLVGMIRAQDDFGMMLKHEPFVPIECSAILSLGRGQGA
ncbi:MAG: hypothetical protein Q9219_004383 [cf. Caloplaca sp. 3 TL-2023]